MSTARPEKLIGDMRGVRYGEVLAVYLRDHGLEAEVFGTQLLNDCPQAVWATLDATAIAAENGVPIARLNGPRYWLMNSVEKVGGVADLPMKEFGGLGMYRQATVAIGPLATAATPYVPRPVSRSTVFVFDAGQRVYELRAPDGRTFVMQTYSVQIDPSLTEAKLTDLGARLNLPAGWTYSSRILDTTMRVETTSPPATGASADASKTTGICDTAPGISRNTAVIPAGNAPGSRIRSPPKLFREALTSTA